MSLGGKVILIPRGRVPVAVLADVCPLPVKCPDISWKIVHPGKLEIPLSGPGISRLLTWVNPKLLPAVDFFVQGCPGTFLHTMSWVLEMETPRCSGSCGFICALLISSNLLWQCVHLGRFRTSSNRLLGWRCCWLLWWSHTSWIKKQAVLTKPFNLLGALPFHTFFHYPLSFFIISPILLNST